MNFNPGGGWKLYDKIKVVVGNTTDDGNTTAWTVRLQFGDHITKFEFSGDVIFDEFQTNSAGVSNTSNFVLDFLVNDYNDPTHRGSIGNRIDVNATGSGNGEYGFSVSATTQYTPVDGIYSLQYEADIDNATVKFRPTAVSDYVMHVFDNPDNELLTWVRLSVLGQRSTGEWPGLVGSVVIPWFTVTTGANGEQKIYPCYNSGTRKYNFFNTTTGTFMLDYEQNIRPSASIDTHNNYIKVSLYQ